MAAQTHHYEPLARLIDATVDRLDARAVRQTLLLSGHPPDLGPRSKATLNDAFSTGIARLMIAQGGWIPAKRPEDSGPTRIWERYPDYKLGFSPYSQKLLVALLIQPVLDPQQQLPHYAALSLGDQLTLFLVARLLSRTGLGEAIRTHHCFGASALCRVGFPHSSHSS